MPKPTKIDGTTSNGGVGRVKADNLPPDVTISDAELEHYTLAVELENLKDAAIRGAGIQVDANQPTAFVSNNLVVDDNPEHNTVIDIPTTAAASLVTLPATCEEGISVVFVADGTKNGHTVQYLDATGPTNLTTALTASKRHRVVASFLNGKWYASAYVSP